MKVTLNWLKQYVDFDWSPEQLAERLTMLGLEVEGIRKIAGEYLDNACIGKTIEVNGDVLPYRPVAVTLGKTVTNGWGGYECCWARTVLATLVGAAVLGGCNSQSPVLSSIFVPLPPSSATTPPSGTWSETPLLSSMWVRIM